MPDLNANDIDAAKKIIAGEIGSDADNAEMFLVTIDAVNGELVVR